MEGIADGTTPVHLAACPQQLFEASQGLTISLARELAIDQRSVEDLQMLMKDSKAF